MERLIANAITQIDLLYRNNRILIKKGFINLIILTLVTNDVQLKSNLTKIFMTHTYNLLDGWENLFF